MIDRGKIIKAWENVLSRDPFDVPWDLIDDTFELLKDLESVVRCKDCKYAHMTDDCECKYCDMFTDDDGRYVECYYPGDWYCADGERLETE